MEYISTKLFVSDSLTMTGYYCVTKDQYTSIMEWYDAFSEPVILEHFILDPCNFEIERIEEDLRFIETFINNYGNPFSVLESIPEIEHVFISKIVESNKIDKHDKHDDDLYTETEQISKIIHAHMVNDEKTIKKLLPSLKSNKSDHIVAEIRKQHKYK